MKYQVKEYNNQVRTPKIGKKPDFPFAYVYTGEHDHLLVEDATNMYVRYIVVRSNDTCIALDTDNDIVDSETGEVTRKGTGEKSVSYGNIFHYEIYVAVNEEFKGWKLVQLAHDYDYLTEVEEFLYASGVYANHVMYINIVDEFDTKNDAGSYTADILWFGFPIETELRLAVQKMFTKHYKYIA